MDRSATTGCSNLTDRNLPAVLVEPVFSLKGLLRAQSEVKALRP